MDVLRNDIVVCIDVDDTLILWNHPEPDMEIDGIKVRRHKEHIESLKRHFVRGHYVIVWSAGGFDWAKKAIERLSLTSYVHKVMCKPRWMLDDKDPSEWTEVYYYKGRE